MAFPLAMVLAMYTLKSVLHLIVVGLACALLSHPSMAHYFDIFVGLGTQL